jgi:hypothetical protein
MNRSFLLGVLSSLSIYMLGMAIGMAMNIRAPEPAARVSTLGDKASLANLPKTPKCVALMNARIQQSVDGFGQQFFLAVAQDDLTMLKNSTIYCELVKQ